MNANDLNVKSLSIPETKTNSIISEKNIFNDEFYKHNYQIKLINKIYLQQYFDKDKKVISIIKKKISSYKQQDKNKKILRKEFPIITFDEVTEKLVESKLKCYYCKCEILLLYKQVREKKQWTLDRIDNSVGHHKDNVVISCLECNLKRRTTEIDRFTFTKQLKISKIETVEPVETGKQPDETKENDIKEIKKGKNKDIKIIKSNFL